MSLHLVITQLGWTLLHFLWQGALIAGGAALGLMALRHARPQARYLLFCTALFACAAWPAASLMLRLADSGAVSGAMFRGEPGLAANAGGAHGALPLAWLHAHMDALVVAWAACAGALSLRMSLGLWWIARAARLQAANAAWQEKVDALAERLGIGRKVRLRIVDSLASPLTAGCWRPVVLLPASLLTGMPAELIEALLAHELGHIKRWDYLVNLCQNIVETLLFYHPAVWWLSGRIRIERERIADDLAAHHVGQRRLALALSELEKHQFSSHHLALAANGGDLMSRITRLLRPEVRHTSWKAAAPVMLLAGLFVAGCAQLSGPATPVHEPVHTRAMADFKSCSKPLWPKQSLRDENTGTVLLGFLVDEHGKVLDSTVKKSSGFAPLDEAARTGISKCSFKPATLDGKPVQEWMQMQYIWTLT
ncbi:MAG: TonB family protein [Massilia sp.]